MRQFLIQSHSQNCLELKVPTIGPQTLPYSIASWEQSDPLQDKYRRSCTIMNVHMSPQDLITTCTNTNSENPEVILLQKTLVHGMGRRFIYTI